VSNEVFPTLKGLTFPVMKSPIWSTRVQVGVSGKETRLGLWSYPIWKYSIPFDFLRSDNVNLEFQTLMGFYNSRFGPQDDWLFNDPDDNTAVAQQFGVGNGSTTIFQLTRTLGGFVEPVRATIAVTDVSDNGSTVNPANYTVNATTGKITFTSAPVSGHVLTWSGTYYWRCRFLDDELSAEKFANQFWSAGEVNFQSCK